MPALHYFSLLFILLPKFFAAAQIHCYQRMAANSFGGPYRPPEAPDCHFIIAQLPSNPPPQTLTRPHPFSFSLPFLPVVDIRHSTCIIQLSFVPSGPNPFQSIAQFSRLNAPGVVDLYSVMKNAGSDVVRECIEDGDRWGGTATGKLGDVTWTIAVSWWSPGLAAQWRARVANMRTLMASGEEAPEAFRGRRWGHFWEL